MWFTITINGPPSGSDADKLPERPEKILVGWVDVDMVVCCWRRGTHLGL